MKYKYTKLPSGTDAQLDNAKNLLQHGTDAEGEFMTVEDALNMPNAGLVFKRAIEEVILAPMQPNLIGAQLIRTTFVEQGGRSISVRTLGAVDLIDFTVPEEGEYKEISAATGGGSILELKFAKFGCKFKISEELLEYSTWDLINLQIQQIVNAMARFRDKAIFNMLFSRGIRVFDNKNPSDALVGRTVGRDITGAGNGSMTFEDLITMYSVVQQSGYTPNVLLCHPLHWAMFAKDPILRNAGFMKGDISQYLGTMMNDNSAYNHAPYSPKLGVRRELTPEEHVALDRSTPTLPSYNPISGITILTSPLVPYNETERTGDILLLDTNNSGILAISEPLNLTEWDEQRNDLKVIKFREKWALDVVDNGKAIAVAKNISFDSNEMFYNPVPVIDNISPIARK